MINHFHCRICIIKVEHADYQSLHRLLSNRGFVCVLIINYLHKFSHLKKVKQSDNKRVSQCSGCSVCKSGTLGIEIINEKANFSKKMKIKKGQLILSMFVVLQSAAIFTANAQIAKIPHGILVKAGGRQVGLMAVKNTVFCLSLNDSIAPSAINSVFIDDSNKVIAPFTVISAAPSYGIKTAYGKLMINTSTNTWSLYDAAGRVLIRDGGFSSTGTSIQITHTAQGLLYGSGNRSTKALEKNQSTSSVSNGVTDIPYFWNNAGYSAFGVSANDDNPAKWDRANNKATLTWKFSGKAANLYLWPAKTMYDAARGYVKLTGRPKLPPRWAFGYLQSKWGWTDGAYVSDVAGKFRSHKLPVDAFIFDFEWYTTLADYAVKKEGEPGFTDFTFNPQVFPSPAKQIAELKSQGIKFIGIRKPRLGNTKLLDTARKNGWLISPKTDSRDLNFSSTALRKWYDEKKQTADQSRC